MRSVEKEKRRERGRPAGSRNVAEVVEATASRCSKCQSTRKECLDKTVQHYANIDSKTGQPFNQVVRRRVRCLDCGQQRIDRTHEFHPDNPRRAG